MSDEKTIRDLEQYVERAKRILEDIDREHPPADLKHEHPDMQEAVAADKLEAVRGLDAAQVRLAEARATFERNLREQGEAATARALEAAERSAAAGEKSAAASRDSALWAMVAAIFTAIAAAISLGAVIAQALTK